MEILEKFEKDIAKQGFSVVKFKTAISDNLINFRLDTPTIQNGEAIVVALASNKHPLEMKDLLLPNISISGENGELQSNSIKLDSKIAYDYFKNAFAMEELLETYLLFLRVFQNGVLKTLRNQ